jgi:hypothetical protein
VNWSLWVIACSAALAGGIAWPRLGRRVTAACDDRCEREISRARLEARIAAHAAGAYCPPPGIPHVHDGLCEPQPWHACPQYAGHGPAQSGGASTVMHAGGVTVASAGGRGWLDPGRPPPPGERAAWLASGRAVSFCAEHPGSWRGRPDGSPCHLHGPFSDPWGVPV